MSNQSSSCNDKTTESQLRLGLSSTQSDILLKSLGPNRLPQKQSISFFKRFLIQFKSALIYILLVALIIDLSIWFLDEIEGWPIDAIAIGLILMLNASLGVWQESKAENALTKLNALATQKVWVIRDGKLGKLSRDLLVPGDVIRIEAGERIPADLVLIDDIELIVDESILTGESEPVSKTTGEDFFSGTLLVQGKGYFTVEKTGSKSALGKLATLLSELENVQTPLEKRLQHFGKQVGIIVVIIAFLLLLLGVWFEGLGSFNRMFLFAVALAVAAIPEGLPAIISLTLALGIERMSKRKAVVRKMAAVEALGSVSVIATDKTGTLTENKMLVNKLIVSDKELAYKAMAITNDAEADTGAGDPLEQGLYQYLYAQNKDPLAIQKQHPRISSRPFDSKIKYMRVTVSQQKKIVSYFKGAPEVLLKRCNLETSELEKQYQLTEKYAAQGLRLLALAWCEGDQETDLSLIGLVLLLDPPRKEVPQAIDEAKQAGIRVIMLTGDHPSTALTIARQIGIEAKQVITGEQFDKMSQDQIEQQIKNINVFARVKPEHKLSIIKILQKQNQVVAVTGDGVNDAPALKAADVGIAMGQRGSDVSREVADIILLDDNFSTIVAAIEEGRSIYENIKKYIRILFSTNLAEVILVAIGTIIAIGLNLRDDLGNLLLPLLAVQILWINLLTDSFPALTVALDKNPNLMNRQPNATNSPLLDRSAIIFTAIVGGFIGMTSVGLLFWLPSQGHDLILVQTTVFTFLTVSQLSVIIPARKTLEVPSNNYFILIAILICFGLQLMVLKIPLFNSLLHVSMLNQELFIVIGVLTIASWLCAEITSKILRKSNKAQYS